MNSIMSSLVLSKQWIVKTSLKGKMDTGGAVPLSRCATIIRCTMVPRNEYLFPEVSRAVHQHLEKYPNAEVIGLANREPLPDSKVSTMIEDAVTLPTSGGNYEPEQHKKALTKAITETFYKDIPIEDSEVFVTDGSQCEIALQLHLGSTVKIAVQDPSFQAYIDSSVRKRPNYDYEDEGGRYRNGIYMRCGPENNFFPDLSTASRADIIFFCSPNNPTGHAATWKQLEQLVQFAGENGSIIIFDSSYASYVRDDYPRSIFQIAGARKVAIEISSFSKFVGSLGISLGWTVVPNDILLSDLYPAIQIFNRTCFNGASFRDTEVGLACLTPNVFEAIKSRVDCCMKNAKVLVETFSSLGLSVHGGVNAPYVWVHFSGARCWEKFDEILEKTHIVSLPGSAFGPGGEGYLRFSAFSDEEKINEASKRLKALFSSGTSFAHL